MQVLVYQLTQVSREKRNQGQREINLGAKKKDFDEKERMSCGSRVLLLSPYTGLWPSNSAGEKGACWRTFEWSRLWTHKPITWVIVSRWVQPNTSPRIHRGWKELRTRGLETHVANQLGGPHLIWLTSPGQDLVIYAMNWWGSTPTSPENLWLCLEP